MVRVPFPDWDAALAYAVRVHVLCGVRLTVMQDRYEHVWVACWHDRLSIPWGDDHD